MLSVNDDYAGQQPVDDDGGDSDDDAAPAHHSPRSHLVVVDVSNDAVGNPLLWGLT